jgi:hypothetical protein
MFEFRWRKNKTEFAQRGYCSMLGVGNREGEDFAKACTNAVYGAKGSTLLLWQCLCPDSGRGFFS